MVAQSRTFSTLTMENFWKWLLNQFVSTLLGKLFMALPEKPQPGCSTQAPRKLKCWGHLRDSQKGANAASALSRCPAAEPANFTSSVLTSVMLLEYLSHRTTKAFARKGQIFRGNYRHYGIWPWANKSQWKSLFKIPMINLKNVTALHLPWGLFHVPYLL